jgi:sigma-E factor negative regulatory protein RseC
MIFAPVRVISIADGRAQVEPTAQSGCGGCASRSVCGVSGLAKYFAGGRKPVEVQCASSVRDGDELQLQMEEGDLLRAGILAYLLPSLFAIVGAAVATLGGYGDAASVLSAAFGIAAGLLLARLVRWSPRIEVQMNHSFNEGDTP